MPPNHNQQIEQACNDLLFLLDTVVPPTTAHYAVENAKLALTILQRHAADETIKTEDRK